MINDFDASENFAIAGAHPLLEHVVPFLEDVDGNTDLEIVSELLDKQPRYDIKYQPWPQFNYQPRAAFSIAYGIDCILLKYYVSEKVISAIHHTPNSAVYKDSCVEFFIAFGNDASYYNLEFNCVGTCLGGYGSGREARQTVPPSVLKKIISQTRIKQIPERAGKGEISWQITLYIPLEVFVNHGMLSLENTKCRVNFYKCGDDLPEPHFLSWAEVLSPSPNFHLPEFFAEIIFASKTL